MDGGKTMSGSTQKRGRDDHNTNDESLLESLINPNFEELARQFPAFGAEWRKVEESRKAAHRSKLSSHVTQEFSVALSKALLHVHWGVSLTNIPLHHLCPPIPNRYFYVQWMQRDLLPNLQDSRYFEKQPLLQAQCLSTGLDIGTGAVCIYPILFCASSPQIQMYATDIDPDSVRLAQANVDSNPRLRSRIHVIQVPGSNSQQGSMSLDSLFPVGPLRRSMEHISQPLLLAFCMTNPPFYDNNVNETSAITEPRAGDGRARTAMTSHEGSYPGGEVGFVLDMIVDGLYLYLQNQLEESSLSSQQNSKPPLPPGWSSAMCGKKTSWIQLKHIVEQLLGPAHVCATEFGPGQMTRWFLAWTFQRPVARSPLAELPGWSFEVPIATMTTEQQPHDQCSEVVHRIQEYCRTMPDPKISCRLVPAQNHDDDDNDDSSSCTRRQRLEIHESTITLPPWVGDEALPNRIQQILQHRQTMNPAARMQFLPVQGHFVLDVIIIAAAASGQQQTVQVEIDAYQHSAYGKKMIEKIKSQMAGEICRTNRRWRRKLQREQQQHQHAMDES